MNYEKNRQSELLIDIDAMVYNYNKILKNINGRKILPVLKASGYGIGAKNVKKFLDKAKINIVGTAFVDEGITLRAGLNYNGEIVVLNQPSIEEIDNIIEHDITVGICYVEFAKKLNEVAGKRNTKARIHIEIETGMGRTGVQKENLDSFIKELIQLKNIEVDGIYTHFSTSDSDLEYTKKQIEVFNIAVKKVKENFKEIKYIHCANSGAILNLEDYPGNMVRPGIILYGYYPSKEIKNKLELKPVCTLKSKISFMKGTQENTPISYGRTFITNRKTKIANVPIGYADGIRRSLSNNGRVVVNGKIAPIVGTVCMDSFMIDVTDIENVKIGDDVYIWDNKIITLDEVAEKCNTINYEIISTISNRVIRKVASQDVQIASQSHKLR